MSSVGPTHALPGGHASGAQGTRGGPASIPRPLLDEPPAVLLAPTLLAPTLLPPTLVDALEAPLELALLLVPVAVLLLASTADVPETPLLVATNDDACADDDGPPDELPATVPLPDEDAPTTPPSDVVLVIPLELLPCSGGVLDPLGHPAATAPHQTIHSAARACFTRAPARRAGGACACLSRRLLFPAPQPTIPRPPWSPPRH